MSVPHRDVLRAARLMESFREKAVGRITRRRVDYPAVAVSIGKGAALEYYTTHGRRRVLYRHEFKSHARPDFLVSGDGRMLLLLGGRFRFTARGIVDSRPPRS